MGTKESMKDTARVLGRTQPARYPWGQGYPPQAVQGNYADQRIADTLADSLPDYDDGFRGSAPVGSFAAGPGGVYALGGNVAWNLSTNVVLALALAGTLLLA